MKKYSLWEESDGSLRLYQDTEGDYAISSWGCSTNEYFSSPMMEMYCSSEEYYSQGFGIKIAEFDDEKDFRHSYPELCI